MIVKFSSILFAFLLIAIFFSGCIEETTTIQPKTIYVDNSGGKDYTSIQDALDNVSDGYTIYVSSGYYTESLSINKSISLIGENKETTIIDGGNKLSVIKIETSLVNISGFTIQNGGSGIIISRYEGSIGNCKIFENIITNCLNGITLSRASFCFIFNNTISHNRDIGIGMYMIEIFPRWDGTYIFCSVNNSVFLNDFIDNNQNAFDENYIGYNWEKNFGYQRDIVSCTCNNTWYNKELELGNYWDDYNGTNTNEDGIGDTPYNITGGTSQDKFPLIREGFVLGEIRVTFNGTITQDEITTLVESYNLSIKDRHIHTGLTFVLIEVPTNKEAYWIKIFKNQEHVKYAGINGIGYLS
jgi:parallel beta-helix repeat protein